MVVVKGPRQPEQALGSARAWGAVGSRKRRTGSDEEATSEHSCDRSSQDGTSHLDLPATLLSKLGSDALSATRSGCLNSESSPTSQRYLRSSRSIARLPRFTL